MKKIFIGLASCLVVFFSGCENDKAPVVKEFYPRINDKSQMEVVTENVPTRTVVKPDLKFNIDMVQTFGDPYAYGGKRSVYIVKDLETGKEYIGVSGIGISERGVHDCGKNKCQDER